MCVCVDRCMLTRIYMCTHTGTSTHMDVCDYVLPTSTSLSMYLYIYVSIYH